MMALTYDNHNMMLPEVTPYIQFEHPHRVWYIDKQTSTNTKLAGLTHVIIRKMLPVWPSS
jgi:hypothetical protein